MDYKSSEESDLSDSEINDYKDKPYEQLRTGEYIVKHRNGLLRCPFCSGKKKQDYKYKDLLQHASGVAKGSANRSAKQKANHLALALYLETDLADMAELAQVVKERAPKPEKAEQTELFCWPWVVVVVSIAEGAKSFDSQYWLKKFSSFKPHEAEVFWDDQKQVAQAILRFGSDWQGYHHAGDFEKFFVTNHCSKEEWNTREGSSDLETYGWLGRADDYEAEGAVGEYLRKVGELKTISDVTYEAEKGIRKKVAMLASKIDLNNDTLEKLQCKQNEQTMSLGRVIQDTDMLQHLHNEETRKVQQLARANIQRVLAERERLNDELEVKKKELDSRFKQLNKLEAVTEREKQKQLEEMEKNASKSTSLEMASIEQKKADENILRLLEDMKKEKEEALNKMIQLESELVEKHRVEMEREELKGQLLVMKHLGDQDDSSVKGKMKELEDQLEEKDDHLSFLQDQVNQLHTKERQSNDELEEARKFLIKGLAGMLNGSKLFEIKRMGELDVKIFYQGCKEKISSAEAECKALELCSLWQEKLKNPHWYPFKMVPLGGDNFKQVIDEDDETLKSLKEEWGETVCKAVTTALEEMNEFNPSGRYVVSEVWNIKEKRKASMKEIITHMLNSLSTLKRKRR